MGLSNVYHSQSHTVLQHLRMHNFFYDHIIRARSQFMGEIVRQEWLSRCGVIVQFHIVALKIWGFFDGLVSSLARAWGFEDSDKTWRRFSAFSTVSNTLERFNNFNSSTTILKLNNNSLHQMFVNLYNLNVGTFTLARRVAWVWEGLFVLIRIFLNSGKYCERQRREPLGVSGGKSLPQKMLKSRNLEMLFSVVSTWIFQTRSSLK